MEVWSAIGNLSPGVAVGVVCLYFYNAMALRYLEERRELVQQVLAERKEWTDALRTLNQQYIDLLKQAVESMTKMGGEMHALRGKVHEFIAIVETRMATISEQLRTLVERQRGAGGND